MSTPLLSFCIPTYGRAHFIRETIESALAQTLRDIEVVVVDDQSPDDTEAVVASIKDPRVRYFKNEANLGVPENLNCAISHGSGQFLVLLEDHDLLEPTYAEETLRLLDRHPRVGFVATGLTTIDETGALCRRYVEDLPEVMAGRRLLRRLLTRPDCPFSVTTVMRRSVVEQLTPLFDARYWWYADQYLWIRFCTKADFGYVSKSLLRFRTREQDHYLSDRLWESLLCVDRIHRENWSLLYPRRGPASAWARLQYEYTKVRKVAVLRVNRRLAAQPWTASDAAAAGAYVWPPSRVLSSVTGLVPRSLLRRGLQLYRQRHSRVYNVGRLTETPA